MKSPTCFPNRTGAISCSISLKRINQRRDRAERVQIARKARLRRCGFTREKCPAFLARQLRADEMRFMQKVETEPTRSIDSLSMLWPLTYGDIIELDGPQGGELWRVDRSSGGWRLHRPGNICDRHPTIFDIDSMVGLIEAILQNAGGYSK